MKLAVVMLMAASCSGLMVAPLPATGGAQRCVSPNMMWRGAKGVPKGEVPKNTKADDKSWGLYAWLSDTLGGGTDEADTGPRFGKFNMNSRGSDADGNFKGDRRVFSDKAKKKTANEGAKFNPFDASTW